VARSRSVWRTAFATSLSCAKASGKPARNVNAKTAVIFIRVNLINAIHCLSVSDSKRQKPLGGRVLPAYDPQAARPVELDGLKPSSLDLPREQVPVHWPIN